MDRSAKFWNRMASTYDREEETDEPTTSEIIEKTRAYLTSRDTVLDFGCATGRNANLFADQVAMIHAMDTSSKMIEIARARTGRHGISNIEYAHATLFDERYSKASFDVVLAFYILHLLDDADQTMRRINALLKPGGLFISATPCMGEQKGLGLLLSLAGKTGLIPRIRPFRIPEIEESIAHAGFEILETVRLHPRGQQRFIVARKTEGT